MPRKKVDWKTAYRSRFIKLGAEWLDLADVTKVTPSHGPSGVRLKVKHKDGEMDYEGSLVDDVHKALKKEGF